MPPSTLINKDTAVELGPVMLPNIRELRCARGACSPMPKCTADDFFECEES